MTTTTNKVTNKTTTRRELLRNAAIFGGALFFSRNLIACAVEKLGEDDNEESTTSDLVSCSAPVISANHGHTLVLPSADIEAGVEKTYSIKGQSNHDHLITITAAQFTSLRAGGSITVTSSNVGGHTHSVRVTCAAPTNPSDAGTDSNTSSDGSTSSPSDGGAPDSSTQPDATAPSTCANGARAASISANHGHTLSVPKADIQTGTTRTYSIQGTSSHPHDVTITAADFTRLKNGETLTLTSTNVGGHTHAVKVLCA